MLCSFLFWLVMTGNISVMSVLKEVGPLWLYMMVALVSDVFLETSSVPRVYTAQDRRLKEIGDFFF